MDLLCDWLGLSCFILQEGLNLVETKATEMMTPEPRNAALKKSTPLWKKSPSISPRFSTRMSAEKKEGIVNGKSEVTGLPGDIQLKASRDVRWHLCCRLFKLLFVDNLFLQYMHPNLLSSNGSGNASVSSKPYFTSGIKLLSFLCCF